MIDFNKSPEEMLEFYIRLFNKIQIEIESGKSFPVQFDLFSDYFSISSPSQADIFFERYGVGNLEKGIHNPFERQYAYELLLHILLLLNKTQFEKIHKGTPYYFIAWTTYQYRDFAKAIYYMDAAVSEDLKFDDVQNRKSTRPSLDFFY